MANNPSVSVVVPMYKVEQYIKICVDSILAQTFQDFEIILVDDASPDNCFKICQKLYGSSKKVRIVRHKKNLGIGPARNTGMKNARGKYIYFVDSDDFILPNALEKFYNAAEKNNAQVVHAAGRYELLQDEPEPIRQENLKLEWDKYNQEGFLPTNVPYRLERHWKNYETWSTAWLCFCRRDFLQKNHIEFLPIISEDEPFSFMLYYLTERYYIIHEALYVYRKRTSSIMRTFDNDKLSKAINSSIIGSVYIEKFLYKIPGIENQEAWRESVMHEFFTRFSNHTFPYYEDLKFPLEKNAVLKKTLTSLFGERESFVRFLFNNYHWYHRRTEILEQQSSVLFYQNQQLQNAMAIFLREQPALLELMTSIKADGKRIILMGAPQHGNLGDQAIAWGDLHILNKYFPEHKVIEIPQDYLAGELGELLWGLGLEKFIRRNDIIFWHGGGNPGNLWLSEENIRRTMIEKFSENKFVVFPQSIYFTDDAAGRKELEISQRIYNSHSDLHLMTRDEDSFTFAKKFFPRINNYLLPDSVTVLQGIMDDVDDERSGVLFVLRNDKEKVRDEKNIQRLQNYLAAKNIPFEITDTVINEKVTADIRERKVRDVLLKLRKSKLVITDRFHGVIFSFVTRTPVLAFKSLDTKISSGIKWFKNLPSIFYAENQDWSSMQNFIDKYYLAATDEKISNALNLKVDTDSTDRFIRALNQIVDANRIYNMNSTPPPHSISYG